MRLHHASKTMVLSDCHCWGFFFENQYYYLKTLRPFPLLLQLVKICLRLLTNTVLFSSGYVMNSNQ